MAGMWQFTMEYYWHCIGGLVSTSHTVLENQCATILVVVRKLRELNDDYFPSDVPIYVVRL
jgi:hypothetical protein